MAGFDPGWFLNCDDPLAVRVAELVANRRAAIEDVRSRNLAVHIRNQIGEMLGG